MALFDSFLIGFLLHLGAGNSAKTLKMQYSTISSIKLKFRYRSSIRDWDLINFIVYFLIVSTILRAYEIFIASVYLIGCDNKLNQYLYTQDKLACFI